MSSSISRFNAYAIVFFAIFSIAGCASAVWPKGQLDNNFDHWQGRIAVKVQTAPPQAFSANFDIVGDARQGQMELSTPLGTTLALLRWSPQNAVLQTTGAPQTFASIGELMQAAIGVELPVEALFQWLHGQDARSVGWSTDLSQFASGRLAAQRSSPQPLVDLKIVLDR